MKKISWITHPQYDIALPKNHKFTASKFSDLFKYLQIKDFYFRSNILEPNRASIEELKLVHDREYILKIVQIYDLKKIR